MSGGDDTGSVLVGLGEEEAQRRRNEGGQRDDVDMEEGEEDSEVDIEGIEQDEGDEEAAEEDVGGGVDNEEVNKNDKNAPSDIVDDTLATTEQKELEEARRERMELMASEQKKRAGALSPATLAGNGDAVETPEKKLEYILAQSEVFAHFLAGSVAASGKAKKGAGSRGKKDRMTEAEEDAQMLKTAQSRRRGIVRLDKQPSNLASHCKMHPYQLEGLNWMIKLHDHGINGILADEMGLGKTLQTISLLAYLRESRGVRGPHLVVVPKSVVGNWIREFKKWCPVVRAVRMGGTKDERRKFMEQEMKPDAQTGRLPFDVLVTSYEGILKEKGRFSKISWKYLIIDEAHRIKNENSSLSRAVRQVNTEHRLLITGTPLQNNLHELWALLNFLMPDLFGDANQFDQWFSLSDERGQENVIKRLHTVLRPFMLRRVKKDVACALPPKKETKLFIGLTPMQQEWYQRILRKDAHELNSLGGPDRVRLLNILMQLRKVCNHPYLFDGAEPGPPFSDGPHLWENSGKMMLLHKLLPKLKARGSRVLIFTQMTRILDIMEDYLRFVRYEYCRIDGNTDGEARDTQMDVFNAPASTKFAFILSTRAGGLGINLATADIVIIFDSDWNPQVDLQAMDRAHRIGQTKPVQVFRFITEGTVEEKIIERADRKLFLDAAVIQQGRLAEKHTNLEKKELMQMVRFGADEILNGKGGTYTDEDIDALIARGEERTNAIQAKLQTDAQHNLASFSLLGEDETSHDTFSFGGKNYRGMDKNKDGGTFINLPQRERKRNYDVNEYYREAMNTGTSGTSGGMKSHAPDVAAKKKRKGPNMQDFQLYDRERLEALLSRERDLGLQKAAQIETIKTLRLSAKSAPSTYSSRVDVGAGERSENINARADEMEAKLAQFDLSSEEQAERDQLLSEGFPDWSRKDFKAFCSSMERHGRYDVENIVKDVANECGKDESEVKRYFVAFWSHYQRIGDWKKILDKIEKGERKAERLQQIRDAIQDKVDYHLEETFGDLFADVEMEETVNTDGAREKPNADRPHEVPSADDMLYHSWHLMKFIYPPGTKNRAYTEEEDAFLVWMMHRHGYGAAERIRMEIRRAWQFRFDWYFKSRNAQEIQKRCDILIKVIERENEEAKKIEEQEAEREKEHSNVDG